MPRILVFIAALVAAATALSPIDAAPQLSYRREMGDKDNMPPSLMTFNKGSSTAASGGPNPKQPANPVIAIVTVRCRNPPPAAKDANTCLDDYYVRWLQAQGTRVVPMPIWWSWEKKKELMSRINGVLFPGGGEDGQAFTDYLGNASQIINYAYENPGFLIWGTCMGFQVISIVSNDMREPILTCDYEGMYPSMLPLEFTTYQPYSTLFGREAQQAGVVHTAATTESTLNYHKCGIDPKNFKPNPKFNMNVISNNVDVNNKPFVSTIESVDNGVNIFGVQYHPERPPYQFSSDAITHDRATLDLSNYMSRFINERLKLNNQSFKDQSDVNTITIDNHYHVYNGWGAGYYWMKL